MARCFCRKPVTSIIAAALVTVLSLACGDSLWAAKHKQPSQGKEQAAKGPQVELFDAMSQGDVEVNLIPKNATQATVLIKNKSQKPLRIKLPEAFAGVPVLAQLGIDGGGGGRFDRGGGGGGTQQSFGGGMGGMGGMGMGGMGMGMGGFMNVAPDQVRKIKVATVCLEHGKPDPNPRVPYELKPLESFTRNKAVIELCALLGRGKIDQRSAQAAAWHMTDNLSWPELANKVKTRHLNGTTELYFNVGHVQRAYRVVQQLSHLATEEAVPVSPGEIEAAQARAKKVSGI